MKKLLNIKYYIFEYVLLTFTILEFMLFNFIIITGILWFIYIVLFLYIRSKQKSKKQLKYYDGFNSFISGFKRTGKDLSLQRYVIIKYKKQYDKQVKKMKKLYKQNKLQDYILQVAKDFKFIMPFKEFDLMYYDDLEMIYFHINPNYLSNIDYGYGVRIVDLSEFRLYKDVAQTQELTFQDFLNNPDNIHMTKNLSFEGKELIYSDTQLYLPASYYQILIKKYPSFPIFFQLAGQLYDMTIIINSQLYNLVWDKLRDQADLYIQSIFTFPKNKKLKTIHAYLPIMRNRFLTKLYIYERMETAEKKVFPYVPRAGIKDRALIKADKLKFDSENGKILKLTIVTHKKDIRYDTRYFATKIFK